MILLSDTANPEIYICKKLMQTRAWACSLTTPSLASSLICRARKCRNDEERFFDLLLSPLLTP